MIIHQYSPKEKRENPDSEKLSRVRNGKFGEDDMSYIFAVANILIGSLHTFACLKFHSYYASEIYHGSDIQKI